MATNSVPAYGIYPVATVRDVAESLGFEKSSDQVCRAVAGDVEFRLSMIIQEAQKFMRHGKRSTMLPSDVEYALQVLNVQPILHPSVPLAKPTFLPVYPAASLKATPPTSSNPQGTPAQPQVYYLQDEEIDLAAFLKGAKEVPVRAKSGAKAGVTWKAHWLAVEGIQPLIKENPVTQIVDPSTAFAALHNHTHNIRPPRQATQSALLARTHLSQELQLLFSRLTEALVPDPAIGGLAVVVLPGINGSVQGNGTGNVESGPSRIAVPTDRSRVNGAPASGANTMATLTDAERARQAALSTLLSDPGLAELLPYLIRWMSESIIQSVTSGPLMLREGKDGSAVGSGTAMGRARTTVELGYLVDGLEALGDNATLFVEPYLHQFLPPIMSVLLSTPLGAEKDPLSRRFPPRDLRAKAAGLLGKLMRTYGAEYETLLPRVVKALHKALVTPATPTALSPATGQTSTIGRHEGALLGLQACGTQAVVSGLIKRGGIGSPGKEGDAETQTGLKQLEVAVSGLDLGDRLGLIPMVQSIIKSVFEDGSLGSDVTAAGSDGDVAMHTDEVASELRETFGPMFGEGLIALDDGKWARMALSAAG